MNPEAILDLAYSFGPSIKRYHSVKNVQISVSLECSGVLLSYERPGGLAEGFLSRHFGSLALNILKKKKSYRNLKQSKRREMECEMNPGASDRG